MIIINRYILDLYIKFHGIKYINLIYIYYIYIYIYILLARIRISSTYLGYIGGFFYAIKNSIFEVRHVEITENRAQT